MSDGAATGTSPSDMREWAAEHRIHPHVLGYLLSFGPMSESGLLFADHLGWKAVSNALDDGSDDRLWQVLLNQLSEVGAHSFLSFRRLAATMPRYADIADGTVTALPEGSLSAGPGPVFDALQGVLLARLRLVQKEWGSTYADSDAFAAWLVEFNHVAMFVGDNLTPEYAILLLRTLSGSVPSSAEDATAHAKLTRQEAFVTLTNRFASLTLDGPLEKESMT